MVNLFNLNDPFFRTSVGFDKMFDSLERLNSASSAEESYPPYNLIRTGDDSFVIEIALAGFKEKELNVEVKENVLHIHGEKSQEEIKKNYIHKGIGGRRFHKTFTLAEYVQVENASFIDGIVTINCEREIPEEKKPRNIKLNIKDVLDPVDKEFLSE